MNQTEEQDPDIHDYVSWGVYEGHTSRNKVSDESPFG